VVWKVVTLNIHAINGRYKTDARTKYCSEIWCS